MIDRPIPRQRARSRLVLRVNFVGSIYADEPVVNQAPLCLLWFRQYLKRCAYVGSDKQNVFSDCRKLETTVDTILSAKVT